MTTRRASPFATLFASAGLALLVTACQPGDEKAAAPIRPVASEIAAASSARAQSFTGTVEPRVRADVSFQVLGQLVARHVSAGDLVRKGDVLAAIDPAALEFAVRSAEAAARAQSAELDNARTTAARLDALKASGTAATALWENAHTALDAAEARMKQAEADLAKARDVLTFATLTAEFDGVVTSTAAEVGQTVAAGQTIVTLAEPDIRDAVIDVPDWLAEEYVTGMGFSVALQIAPSMTVRGELREIAPQADTLTRTRRLKIALDDPGPVFRLGSIVSVHSARNSRSLMALPDAALLDRDGKSFVWIVTEDGARDGSRRTGTVSLRQIETGAEGSGLRLVTGGVAAGERVVVAGVHSLTDGQRVAIDGGAL